MKRIKWVSPRFRFGLANRVGLGSGVTTNPPSRRPNVIDLIYTNVHIMQTRTVGGALYFVTFINDHSRKFWGFAMKTKDHVLDAFKELHAKFEREK